MRLTPKSIFFGILVLGLPFAVTVGWTLGTPVTAPSEKVAAPGGAGAIGSAPDRGDHTSTNGPVSPVDYAGKPRPSSSGDSGPASAAAVVPVTSLPPGGGATTGLPMLSISPLPPLTDPPVPTPTDISTPPSPSPTASTVPSTNPSGGIGAGLIP